MRSAIVFITSALRWLVGSAELYHTDIDRSETHDLAAAEPERLQELINLWYAEAGANGAFPLDDRQGLEILLTPRPLLSPVRGRYVYYPGIADVPESQAVNIRNRSYAIGALVDIPERGSNGATGANGVLFAHGSRFGGHALYVKDNRLHHVYSFVGSLEQKIAANVELPTGDNLILATACASGATAATRSPRTTTAWRRGRSRAARSTVSRSTSAASRTSTSSAKPSP